MGTEFDSDLARLAELSDDEIAALESSVVAAFDAADQAGDEVSMAALADALDAIRTEVERRSGGAAEGELAASAEITEDNGEGAAVEKVKVPEDRAPVVVASGSKVTIGADIPGYSAGSVMTSAAELNKAFAARVNTLRHLSGGDGEKVIIASIQAPEPNEDQVLRSSDPDGNAEKIRKATDLKAIVAGGGCCAPLSTSYDLWGIGDTDRPVKASLAGFQADRGGLRFFKGPSLSQAAGAVGVWTCQDDIDSTTAGAPDPVKVCARVNCPTESTAVIQAITMCITYGVIASRVFPELVSTNNQLAMVAQSRVAESVLLAKIKAGSTAMTGTALKYGATRDILLTIAQAGSYFRDRNRLAPGTPLRAILPVWILEALRADTSLGPPSTDQIQGNFAISQSEVEQFFSDRNINVTWALDSAVPGTNGGGFYPAAGASVPAFPSTAEWALFTEGSWLFLDGGSLDLGVVRDSGLVKTNDYMTFAETFETVALLGGDSVWITSPIGVTGQYAPPIAAA